MKLRALAVVCLLLCVPMCAQHVVSLSMTASTGPNVATYTFLRGTVSGGPYTAVVGCTKITTVACTDSTVVSGATYYYVAIATDTSGNNSTYTNQTGPAVIPGPQPPINLTISQISLNPPIMQYQWASVPAGTKTVYVTRKLVSATSYVRQKQLKPTILTYTDPNVKKGKTYDVRLEFVNGMMTIYSAIGSVTVN